MESIHIYGDIKMKCVYCDRDNNDFVLFNQTTDYSRIEISLNKQGMLRVRYYDSKDTNFITQDIVNINFCPICGKSYKRCTRHHLNNSKNSYSTEIKTIPTINIPDLIEWLMQEKYNIDENSDDMSEEFEREHKWELSRNCFINKIIKYIERLK